MTHRVLLPATLVVLAILIGCGGVTLNQPLPSRHSAELLQALEGYWHATDGVFEIRFSDSGKGRLGALEWDEDHFGLIEWEIVATASGDGGFVSMRTQDEAELSTNDPGDPESYVFARFTLTPLGDLVLWAPDPTAFATAVDDGLLMGSVTDDREDPWVEIESPPDSVLAFLEDPANDDLFILESPLVLKRLPTLP